MSNLTTLIQLKTEQWSNEEKKKSQSVVGNLIKYVENSKLREPQIEAVKVYLWLKFVGKNQKLSTIIKQGLLYDDEQAKAYDGYYAFGQDYVTQFLNQFAQDNGLKKLSKKLIGDPKGLQIDWSDTLERLLHNFDYPNYLFSLPMGAGKTYLMACFIYLDLYFSRLFPNDKRFAQNFVIFAPQATKTAILPSLQTIKNFDPKWILPKAEADRIKQVIQIEVLDALSSQRKDKLQGNNPNLEKVNRITQSKDFGLVFITNAEKVVLEHYSDDDKLYTKKGGVFYDEKKAAEVKKYNDLREKLSNIPHLMVVLDEVHHAYGVTEDNGEKKLRAAVNILNQHGNVTGVIGMSGTPYVKNTVKVGDEEIKLNQIQDIVYNYSLNLGIGKFLKVPDVRKREIKETVFVKEALTEFFNDFDVKYADGTKSKIAFYCPSIKKLNEDILPAVQDWYRENRPNKDVEIFRFYRAPGKEDKEYQLPKDCEAIFNNLDKPYSDKRVILLVAIGTEGWNCKSLTAVALPRKETSKNFVLQTTCRCLREVDNAEKEKALIFLGDGNYETLENQLKENYHLSISDLKEKYSDSIAVTIRKPQLGKLKYKQVTTSYQIIRRIAKDPKDTLTSFSLTNIKKQHAYDTQETHAKVGEESLTQEIKMEKKAKEDGFNYSFNDFVYDLGRAVFGKYSEAELLKQYDKQLAEIFSQIEKDKDWLVNHPTFEIGQITKILAASLMEEIEYKREDLTSNVEIELLEWDVAKPDISLVNSSGVPYKFMPRIDPKDVRVFQKHPEDLEAEREKIDPRNISFNYIPYKMDSDFERNALGDMLKMGELSGLEVYFNGYEDSQLQSFWIQTPDGVYTPDFLILKRQGKNISKILILETKGSSFYDNEFKRKEKFVKEVFTKHNPNFRYECFVDEGGNDFKQHTEQLRDMLKSF